MKQNKRIHTARRKMSHVLDEIYTALLLAGGTELDLSIRREEEGLRLQARGDFLPERRREMERMAEFLQPEVRSPAMVEEFWALAGGDQYTSDSELTLVGQMVTEVDFRLGETSLALSLFVPFQG